MIKHFLRGAMALVLIFGCVFLVRISLENRRLEEQLGQLEAELGRMPILAFDKVHLVEIENPQVPPEVESQIARIWQFRCYLPPNYNFSRFSGDGRVTAESLYLEGGYGRSSGSPNALATHELVTVSLQKKDDRLVSFYAFGGSSSTMSWNDINSKSLDDNLVTQKLVHNESGPRSFDQNTILPLIKIYNSATAQEKEVYGKRMVTYQGAMIVLCPKSREPDFDLLRRGETPVGFEASWVASEASDE